MTKGAAGVLAAIQELEAEHQALWMDLGTRLERLEQSLAVTAQEQLPEGRKRMESLIQFLYGALHSHSAKEEKVLRPLLSKTLEGALVWEHREIGVRLENLQTAIAALWEKGKSPGESAPAQTRLQSLVRELYLFLQEHMAEEDAAFRLAKKAFHQEEHGRGKHSRVTAGAGAG